ncbi:hypothetical protein QR680_011333 [Steinernema hermaphroditum]|uniref:Uncharacterized protein n=1 Tax=Steinernema hermaphroditum TaxID=289476 RepID=A0AA39ITD8_9BILA|nr:hypothetical protein QR680_011333 [Steinernema hermaphroditum]
MVKSRAAEHAIHYDCSEDERIAGGASAGTSGIDENERKTPKSSRKEKKAKRKRKGSVANISKKRSKSSHVTKKSKKSKKTTKSKKRHGSRKKSKSTVRSSNGKVSNEPKPLYKSSKVSRNGSVHRKLPVKTKARLKDNEKFSINELNWSTFDVVVSLQIVGAGIFLLLAFVAGIIGISAFWSPMLMSLLLFLCSVPGFWCIIHDKIQDGILAFSIAQLASGLCGLFWGTVTLLDFEHGDRPEDWRSVAIMIIALWQFFTVIVVNTLPYRKVSLVDVTARLKKMKKETNPCVESTVEERPICINVLSSHRTHLTANMPKVTFTAASGVAVDIEKGDFKEILPRIHKLCTNPIRRTRFDYNLGYFLLGFMITLLVVAFLLNFCSLLVLTESH